MQLVLFALFFAAAFGSSSNVPMQDCIIGRHTYYPNQQQAGACQYGSLTGPMGPGYLYIAALNDYTGDGFGWRKSQSCGTCYQVTGISQSVILMVTDYCPDCPILQPHFDMSPEASNVVDGGANAPGGGFTAVTFRKVSCGFTSNVLVQINPKSSTFWLSILFAKHNVPLAANITVQESGKQPVSVQRTTYSYYEFSPSGGGAFVFPIQITVFSTFNDAINFTLTSLDTSGTPHDTGAQFPDPPALTSSPCASRSSCPGPALNNGQSLIYSDTLFPQQVGQWIPLTSQAWQMFGQKPSATSSVLGVDGKRSGQMSLSAFAEWNMGCNVQSSKSEVTRLIFSVRTADSTPGASLQIWSGSGTKRTLQPTPNSASWTTYSFEVANNPDVPAVFNNLQIQNGNTAITYFFSAFQVVFANANDTCSPWYKNWPTSDAHSLYTAPWIMLFMIVVALSF